MCTGARRHSWLGRRGAEPQGGTCQDSRYEKKEKRKNNEKEKKKEKRRKKCREDVEERPLVRAEGVVGAVAMEMFGGFS